MEVRLKRVYETAEPADGYRALIDRLWPLGVSRRQAKLDGWEEELRGERSRLTALRRRAREGTLTLVYSARDPQHNDAVVLAEVLRRGLPAGDNSRANDRG